MNAPTNPAHLVRSAQATYDAWLIQEVQTARDDPRPRITHAEVLRRSALRREELIKQHALVEA
jgi:hypothetical protein